jgi:hypothetical protein
MSRKIKVTPEKAEIPEKEGRSTELLLRRPSRNWSAPLKELLHPRSDY